MIVAYTIIAMQLVPHAGLESLPRKFWKRIYTPQERAKQAAYRQQHKSKVKRLPPSAAEIEAAAKKGMRPPALPRYAARQSVSMAGAAFPQCATNEDFEKIVAVYAQAYEMTKTGVRYSVDHIYPLGGQRYGVCGLHVPANLVVMPLLENMRKNNLPHSSWVDYAGFDA